jgi:hypothetical protein
MKIYISGPRSGLVEQLRTLADTVENDGAAEWWGIQENNLRPSANDLTILFDEYVDSDGDEAILWAKMES